MGVLAEDLHVGLERDERASPVDGAEILELSGRMPALEAHLVSAPVACDLDVHPPGKRVEDGRAHAMKAAGGVVDLAAEFPACVKRGHDYFEGGLVLELRMRIDGNAAPVVAHGEDIARLQLDLDTV